MAAIDALRAAHRARLDGVPTALGTGPVVGYLGTDVPIEVLDAVGIQAVRICGDPGAATPMADTIAEAAIDGQARSVLQRLLDGTCAGLDAVLIGHDSEASARVFHYAAEARHLGIGDVPPVRFVDVLHGHSSAARLYTRHVVHDLWTWAARLAGTSVDEAELAAALSRSRRRREALGRLRARRRADASAVTGTDAWTAIGAAATLGPADHADLVESLLTAPTSAGRVGRRVVLTGGGLDHPGFVVASEGAGLLVVAEDHDWGDGWFESELDETLPPVDALVECYSGGAPRGGRFTVAERAAHVAHLADAAGPEVAIAVLRAGDDGPPWDVPAQRAALATRNIPLLAVHIGGYGTEHVAPAVDRVLDEIERLAAPTSFVAIAERPSPAPTPVAPGGARAPASRCSRPRASPRRTSASGSPRCARTSSAGRRSRW